MWNPAGKQVLYRRCKSGNKTDEQSLPLILFLDVASRCSVRAIYSCHMFCHNRLPSGTWLLPWHLMSTSAGYSNQRSSQYSLLRSPHSPPFLTLSPPLHPHSSSCLSCCHFLSEGTQWPCSQAVMLVWGVCACIYVSAMCFHTVPCIQRQPSWPVCLSLSPLENAESPSSPHVP